MLANIGPTKKNIYVDEDNMSDNQKLVFKRLADELSYHKVINEN